LIGSRLGPYEIVGTVGAGGMGEVYRARDERLGREVAIKTLPADFSADPNRLRRFTQEAKAAGALNHPNVLTVHDVGEHEGALFLVSELLEGETLRERLETGALPPRKACDYAAQVARGLAAAHARGIVHRDLKPENLFVTRDDRVKILDFGLAKLTEREPESVPDGRTMTLGDVTEPGLILGTVGYMSPEQVRGQSSDHRADIFALGAVLQEMLTGERAFRGDSAVAALNAILTQDPVEPSGRVPGVSKTHDEVVRHCLEKNPDHRFQSAQDLAFQLELLAGTSSTSQVGAVDLEALTTGSGRGKRWLLRAAGWVLALGLGTLAGWWAHPKPQVAELPRVQTLTYSGTDQQVAASPDGRTLAFVSGRDGKLRIWLKSFPNGDEAALTEGPDIQPTFSPDGSEILFSRDLDLYRVPVLGGRPRRVAEGASNGAWTARGDRIAFARLDREGSSVHVMAADGSGERLLHSEDARVITDLTWSPDGKLLACTFIQPGANVADPKLLILDAETGDARLVRAPLGAGQPVSVAWSGEGRGLVYIQPQAQATIAHQTLVVRHDLESDEATVLLYIDGVGWSVDVLGQGSVVFGADRMRGNLQEIAGGGGVAGERWLTHGDSLDRQPIYSPDGRWLAFSSNRTGNLDLWVLELDTGQVRRLTDHPGTDWDPAFTPDGRSLVWSSDRDGHFEIWTSEADGRNPRRITNDGFDAENPSVTADGQWLVYNSAHPGKAGVWKVHLDGSDATQLATGLTGLPEVSPDGRYAVFVRTGRAQSEGIIEVVQIADGSPVPFEIHCQVESTAAGALALSRARWLPDGAAIAFVCDDDEGRFGIFAQDFIPGEDTRSTRRRLSPVLGDRIPESFGVSPDGERLVVSQLELRQAIGLAEGLPGVDRPGRRPN
jgi:eukaryotic-like serine/threonine-protein kinase